METAHEQLHFTKEGVLHHCWYTVKPHRFGQLWKKVYGSEAVCLCPERETDRLTLIGIQEAGHELDTR